MNKTGESGRFIGRVHRRRVAVRLLELAGVGAAIGTAAGFVGGMNYIFMLLGGGITLGLLVGWWYRPSRLNSAIEADRQLALKDLLSSAWTLDNPADPWQQAIAAAADHHVRGLSTWKLKFRRTGVAGWSIIGLILLFSIGLRWRVNHTPKTDKHVGQRVFLTQAEAQHPENWLAASPMEMRGVSEDRSRIDTPSENPADHSKAVESRLDAGMDRGHSTGGQADQPGTGSAQSHASDADSHKPMYDSSLGQNHDNGQAAGGTGRPAGLTGNETGKGTIAGKTDGMESSPPWQGQAWKADQGSAAAELHNGQIPGRYRELVRAYFELDRP